MTLQDLLFVLIPVLLLLAACAVCYWTGHCNGRLAERRRADFWTSLSRTRVRN